MSEERDVLAELIPPGDCNGGPGNTCYEFMCSPCYRAARAYVGALRVQIARLTNTRGGVMVKKQKAWAVRAISRDGTPWFAGMFWFDSQMQLPPHLDGQRVALFSSRRTARIGAARARTAGGDRSVAAVRVEITIREQP